MGNGLILIRREPGIVGQQHGSRELMWLFSGISGISVRLSPRYPSFTVTWGIHEMCNTGGIRKLSCETLSFPSQDGGCFRGARRPTGPGRFDLPRYHSVDT
jgi:hypothetical protein